MDRSGNLRSSPRQGGLPAALPGSDEASRPRESGSRTTSHSAPEIPLRAMPGQATGAFARRAGDGSERRGDRPAQTAIEDSRHGQGCSIIGIDHDRARPARPPSAPRRLGPHTAGARSIQAALSSTAGRLLLSAQMREQWRSGETLALEVEQGQRLKLRLDGRCLDNASSSHRAVSPLRAEAVAIG